MIRIAAIFVTTVFVFSFSGYAQVEPVVLNAPTSSAWTGQQLAFTVDIRVKGSFGGATSFSLPKVPGTIVLKIGNPTISSQTIDGETYFVQTHKFSLFSQTTGTITLPAFPVRYGHRDGYIGPVNDYEGTVPSSQFEIRRPPGTENIGFLVTTEKLEISEMWDPVPNSAQVGTVFKRTVQQSSEQLSGMALAPLPKSAPEGIRVYGDDPEVSDRTERGAFQGNRSETLTYLMQEPGNYTLPEIRFVWWNPKKEILESKTLPAVTIAISPSPRNEADMPKTESFPIWKPLAFIIIILVVVFSLLFPAKKAITQYQARLNSPERVTTRKLLLACKANDPAAAHKAYFAHPPIRKTEDLSSALQKLEQILYSHNTDTNWNGEAFAAAFKKAKENPSIVNPKTTHLPPLNPTS